ncbi:MAG: hypothetical protein MJ252_28165 [archaeon]|nr:hypothetical protein [archaeon]
MGFFYYLVDAVLSVLLSLDTLALIYQIRKDGKCEKEDYTRVSFTWVLFIFLKSIFTCAGKGFLCNLFGMIGLILKVAVVIPKLGMSNKVYKKLIEEKKGEQMLQGALDFVKNKFGGAAPPASADTTGK